MGFDVSRRILQRALALKGMIDLYLKMNQKKAARVKLERLDEMCMVLDYAGFDTQYRQVSTIRESAERLFKKY